MSPVGWPSPYPLDEHLRQLGLAACNCPHDWKSLGVLNDIHWGDGWVRSLTVRTCPEHGEEADRVRSERIAAQWECRRPEPL